MRSFSKNPWQADTLQDFSFFCCPECVYKSKEETLFVSHAIDHHPKSVEFINKVDKPWDKPKKVVRKEKQADNIYYSEPPDKPMEEPIKPDEPNSAIDKELKRIQEELEMVEHEAFQEVQAADTDDIDLDTTEFNMIKEINLKEEMIERAEVIMEPFSLDQIVYVEPEVEEKIEQYEDQNVSGNYFNCVFCEEVFDSFAAKKEHIKATHADEDGRVPSTTCTRCNRTLSDPYRAKKNQLCLVCQAERFKCAYCEEKFPTKIMRYSHETMSHTGPNGEMLPVECKICDTSCKNSIDFRMHLWSAHRKKGPKEQQEYKCLVCDKKFENKRKYQVHKSYSHKELKNEECFCPEEGCGFKTWNKKFLYNHKMLKHGEKNHQCDKCGKKFVFPFHLRNHSCSARNPRELGTGEEYACPTCQLTFQTENTMLTHHQKFHGGLPPGYENKEQFNCPHCSKIFFTKGGLVQHKPRCPMTQSQFDLKATCKKCNQEFPFPNFVWHYKHFHNAIPPGYEDKEQFECDKCQSIYFSKDSFTLHQKRVHSKKYKGNKQVFKPKPCPICNKMIQGGNAKLRAHLGNVHSDQRSFQCRACGRGYGTKTSLYWHETKNKACSAVLNNRQAYPQQQQIQQQPPQPQPQPQTHQIQIQHAPQVQQVQHVQHVQQVQIHVQHQPL